MSNRLALETSPYLRQHQDNPVDWQAWGPEAIEQARREEKPILLSVGYSTCHWCHVMAHESFEDPEMAAAMNAHFVCIKVDREERPDLDQIYQTALQMLTGKAGGWPLTMFLFPDGTPFFGGTYFPKSARFNLPGFGQVLESVATFYATRRGELAEQNDSLLAAMADSLPQGGASQELGPTPIVAALADIKRNFDPVHGGFGGAPKFPRPAELDFLFWSGDAEARRMVLLTLDRMAEGGLMDQLGGGFFRYSVDERWAIPHFEKMLYDNGPLLGLYADAWARTGKPLYARAAEMLVTWLEREMTSPEGLFHAALDADSEHEEGRFYVWTPAEVKPLLGADEYAVAALAWGLDSTPNFEDHAWHLGLDRTLDEVARKLDTSLEGVEARLDSASLKLFAARSARVRPGRDDKVLTSWNALMIKGLARAARRFGRADWLSLAQRAADGLRARLWLDGRLFASWQDGRPRHNGYLDDYAFLLDALLELLQAEWRGADLAWARALADALLTRFEDAERGGFYFTSHDHERLIHRTKPAYDNALPAGNGVAAFALNRLGLIVDEPRYGRAAERTLQLFRAQLAASPAPFATLLLGLREHLKPPRLVVLTGPEPELSDWKRAADRSADAGSLLFRLPSPPPEVPASLVKTVRDKVNAYVCAGVTCLPEIDQLPNLLAIFSP